jgi:hypothetical protein
MARFELGEASDHLHHHATRWRRGVDRFGDRAQASAGVADTLHDVEHDRTISVYLFGLSGQNYRSVVPIGADRDPAPRSNKQA